MGCPLQVVCDGHSQVWAAVHLSQYVVVRGVVVWGPAVGTENVAFLGVKTHAPCFCPLFKLFRVRLKNVVILWWVYCPVQGVIICKEAHLWLDSFWQIVDVAQKRDWSQDCALWDAGVHKYFLRFFTLDDYLHVLFGSKGLEPEVEVSCGTVAV